MTDCEQWDSIVEQRRRRHLDLYLKPKERIALNRKYVGVVFQPFHLLDDMKVEENLEEPLPFRDIKGAERNTMVAGTLDRFNMVGK